MAESSGLLTYKWATLVARYRVMPQDIAPLTDAQIDELLLYPRDKDGALKEPDVPTAPPAPPTRESRLAQIDQLEQGGLITAANAKQLREELNRRDNS